VSSSPSTPPAIKTLDTFLRGLKRLAGLSEELAGLEEEVAGQEAAALEKVLEQVRPLLPRLTRQVTLREPWRAEGESGDVHRQEGVVLSQSFQQDRAPMGRISHRGDLLMLDPDGRVLEVTVSGAWTEGPPVTGASWRVDSRERPVTAEVARRLLRPVLTGLLEALRDAIVRGRAERGDLQKRLALLQEVDEVLGPSSSS
jgi:hypothetical protein